MGRASTFARVSALSFCILLFAFSMCARVVSAEEFSLVVGQSTTLKLSPGLLVESSPGSKPGAKFLCERIHIHGLLRLKNLKKFSNSVKVKVSYLNSTVRTPNVEVCFHRNQSLGIGMCPHGQWQKLTKGLWSKSMSPFDHKLLDIRLRGSYKETLEVSLDEEFFLYRVVFLVLGIILMAMASFLSKSLVFYYSSAMAIGIILVILMVLFQGMKLLPTGRKNSLAIFLYSSIVGLGSFLLRYVPSLLRSMLVEIGLGEDMYQPLAVFILIFIFLAGAWLGFWVVRKLVLTEDGIIDLGVSQFVAWSIRIFASVMILQSSVDPLLAAEALVCGIFVASILRRIFRPRFMRHIYRKLHRTQEINNLRSPSKHHSLPPPPNSYGSTPNSQAPYTTPTRGSIITSPKKLLESDTFYSTFHSNPERRRLSKEEWNDFTKESTKRALRELVSSPDFSNWAVAHADRITLAPKEDTAAAPPQRWWFPWL